MGYFACDMGVVDPMIYFAGSALSHHTLSAFFIHLSTFTSSWERHFETPDHVSPDEQLFR
jgi:hypothetical protein